MGVATGMEAATGMLDSAVALSETLISTHTRSPNLFPLESTNLQYDTCLPVTVGATKGTATLVEVPGVMGRTGTLSGAPIKFPPTCSSFTPVHEAFPLFWSFQTFSNLAPGVTEVLSGKFTSCSNLAPNALSGETGAATGVVAADVVLGVMRTDTMLSMNCWPFSIFLPACFRILWLSLVALWSHRPEQSGLPCSSQGWPQWWWGAW